MITKMKATSDKPKEKVRWRMTVTKFDVVKLFILYLLLSPLCAMGLYNQLIFFPFKEKYDLTEIFTKIESAMNAKKIDLTIPSGNEKLNAWYFKKADTKKIFIVSHGNGGSNAHRLTLVSPLLSARASVLLYDYEGYGESTGTPTIPAIKQDGLAVYDYVRNVLHYEPKDIIVYGESLGGGVTTYIAEKRPVSGIVIQSGFSSLTDAAKDRLPWLNLYPKFAFAAIEMDNAAYLHGRHAPLLLIHGDKDATLPIKHARKTFAEASQAKTFVIIEGAGHNDLATFNPKLFAAALSKLVSGSP
ncbi:alpha/beta hydrolase [soil metagenome]